MSEIFKRLFWLKLLALTLGIFLICYFLFCNFSDRVWFPWIIALISSIYTSFLVSVYFQFSLKDEISKEHLSIMKFLNEKNESGIIKYHGSFKNCIEDIKKEFLTSKRADIYLSYGYTILNNLSEEINFFLSDRDKEVNIYIMDENNPFITSYSKHWYTDGDEKKLKVKVKESIDFLKNKTHELKKRDALKGQLNVFTNLKNPVNYSFYLFDEKVFFVPSKNVTTKEFVPIAIVAEKTTNPYCLYNKISTELSMMKKDQIFEKKEF